MHNARRVLLIARKPSWEEFKNMAMVTGLGIVVIGIIGYFVHLLFNVIGIK